MSNPSIAKWEAAHQPLDQLFTCCIIIFFEYEYIIENFDGSYLFARGYLAAKKKIL